MSIVTLLDELHAAREALRKAENDAAWFVPADMQNRLDASKADVERIEAEIKTKAKYIPPSQANTLVGRHLQLVWNAETPVSYVRKAFWAIKKRAA